MTILLLIAAGAVLGAIGFWLYLVCNWPRP